MKAIENHANRFFEDKVK